MRTPHVYWVPVKSQVGPQHFPGHVALYSAHHHTVKLVGLLLFSGWETEVHREIDMCPWAQSWCTGKPRDPICLNLNPAFFLSYQPSNSWAKGLGGSCLKLRMCSSFLVTSWNSATVTWDAVFLPGSFSAQRSSSCFVPLEGPSFCLFAPLCQIRLKHIDFVFGFHLALLLIVSVLSCAQISGSRTSPSGCLDYVSWLLFSLCLPPRNLILSCSLGADTVPAPRGQKYLCGVPGSRGSC